MSRGPWTHVLCNRCWELRNGESSSGSMNHVEDQKCCQCGRPCKGIFVREDPAQMRCKGKHR